MHTALLPRSKAIYKLASLIAFPSLSMKEHLGLWTAVWKLQSLITSRAIANSQCINWKAGLPCPRQTQGDTRCTDRQVEHRLNPSSHWSPQQTSQCGTCTSICSTLEALMFPVPQHPPFKYAKREGKSWPLTGLSVWGTWFGVVTIWKSLFPPQSGQLWGLWVNQIFWKCFYLIAEPIGRKITMKDKFEPSCLGRKGW